MRLYLKQDQENEEAKLGGSVEGEIYLDNQTSRDKSFRQEEMHPVETWAGTNQNSELQKLY